jgi:hypothetical protein
VSDKSLDLANTIPADQHKQNKNADTLDCLRPEINQIKKEERSEIRTLIPKENEK